MKAIYSLALAALLLPGVAPVQAANVFPISKFTIDGNSLLSQAEIDAALAPQISQQADFGHIQRALEALEIAYRKRGYSAVQVFAPEQELTDGTVRIVVTESVLGKVVIPENLQFFDAENLRQGLPGLKENLPPNTRELSSQIELNNENPAKNIEVVLGMGQAEGQVDARLKVEESDPLKFFVGLDNTGNQSTGNSRVSMGLQQSNLLNLDHVLTAAFTTSPEKSSQVQIGSLSYRIPLYSQGGIFDVSYGTSNVDAGSTPTFAGPLTFSGKGDVLSLRYTHIQPRRGEYSSRISIGWDYRNYDNNCALGVFGAAGCAAAAADVVVKPLSIGYSGQKTSPGRATEYSLIFSHNLPGGRKGNGQAFAAARPGGGGAPADYAVLRGTFAHLMAVNGDWQLRSALSAQWTEHPLVIYEQFGLAGNAAVRGFAERDVTADKGIVVNLEAYTPDLSPAVDLKRGSLRALAFVDAGYGERNLLPGETQIKKGLSSAGVGLRYHQGKSLTARFDLARVLDGNGTQRSGDFRGHFHLMFTY